MRGASSFVQLTKHHAGDQVKSEGIGGECDMCGGDERCMCAFGGEM